jgi:hypothetical protein
VKFAAPFNQRIRKCACDCRKTFKLIISIDCAQLNFIPTLVHINILLSATFDLALRRNSQTNLYLNLSDTVRRWIKSLERFQNTRSRRQTQVERNHFIFPGCIFLHAAASTITRRPTSYTYDQKYTYTNA